MKTPKPYNPNQPNDFVPTDDQRREYLEKFPIEKINEFGSISINNVYLHRSFGLVWLLYLCIWAGLYAMPFWVGSQYWEAQPTFAQYLHLAFWSALPFLLVYIPSRAVAVKRKALKADAIKANDFHAAFGPHKTSILFRAGLIFRSWYLLLLPAYFLCGLSLLSQKDVPSIGADGVVYNAGNHYLMTSLALWPWLWLAPIAAVFFIAAFKMDKQRTLLLTWPEKVAPKFAEQALRGAKGGIGSKAKSSVKKMLDALDD